jgi:hypothetical protein
LSTDGYTYLTDDPLTVIVQQSLLFDLKKVVQ